MAAHFHDDHPAIVVRGVSDLIAHKKPRSDQRWQPIASSSAAAFVFEFLSTYDPDYQNAAAGWPYTVPPRIDPATRLGTRLERGPMTAPPRGLRVEDLVSPGTTINDQFVVERLVGVGTFSAVFQCRQLIGDLDLGPVALKIHWSNSSDEHFNRELVALTTLQHPSLLTYRGAGVLHDPVDRRFTVTELAETLLAEMVSTAPLQVDDAVRMCRDIADGLSYLHHSGLIHGDVKPANILLVSNRWVLGDFGLSRPIDDERFEGTPAFMAPEALEGRTNPAGDVYSLGLTLLMALGGESWPGRSKWTFLGTHDLDFAIGQQPPEIPDTLAPALQRVIANCLQPNPSRRPTAEELVAGLSEILSSVQNDS